MKKYFDPKNQALICKEIKEEKNLNQTLKYQLQADLPTSNSSFFLNKKKLPSLIFLVTIIHYWQFMQYQFLPQSSQKQQKVNRV